MHPIALHRADRPPPDRPERPPAQPSDGELIARSVDEPEAFAALFDKPPAFPLTLGTVPAGLTPSYSADPGDVRIAVFRSPDDTDGVALRVTPDEPDLQDTSDGEDVSVRGRDAEVVTEHMAYGDGDVRTREVVVVEWSDDEWVEVSGRGRYGDRDRLLAVARTLVERPQPVPLRVHLAPAGWSVQAYKDDRILTLQNDAYEQQTLNVHLPEQPIPPDQLLGELMAPRVRSWTWR